MISRDRVNQLDLNYYKTANLAKYFIYRYYMSMAAKSHDKKDKQGPIAVNKKAYMNFEIVDKFEAGISLLGTEVKSLRIGAADLSGSYARIDGEQCWLYGATITQYHQAGARPHDPTRKRKLLLHKAEIRKIKIKLEQRGFTFVPLGLARGKRQYDKRKTITERDQKRDLDRNMKKYRK